MKVMSNSTLARTVLLIAQKWTIWDLNHARQRALNVIAGMNWVKWLEAIFRDTKIIAEISIMKLYLGASRKTLENFNTAIFHYAAKVRIFIFMFFYLKLTELFLWMNLIIHCTTVLNFVHIFFLNDCLYTERNKQ